MIERIEADFAYLLNRGREKKLLPAENYEIRT